MHPCHHLTCTHTPSSSLHPYLPSHMQSVSEQLSVLHAKSLAVSRELHVSFTSLHGFMQKRSVSWVTLGSGSILVTFDLYARMCTVCDVVCVCRELSLLEELANATSSYTEPLLKLASIQVLTIHIQSFICFPCFFSTSFPLSLFLTPSLHPLLLPPLFPPSHQQRSSLRVQTQSVTSTITKAVNAFKDSLELARNAKQVKIIFKKCCN